MEISERASEIVLIFKKIKKMNLGIECFEEFETFKKICNTFIRDGKPVSGKINIIGTKRIICYNFNNSVDCMLKYDASV